LSLEVEMLPNNCLTKNVHMVALQFTAAFLTAQCNELAAAADDFLTATRKCRALETHIVEVHGHIPLPVSQCPGMGGFSTNTKMCAFNFSANVRRPRLIVDIKALVHNINLDAQAIAHAHVNCTIRMSRICH